MNHLVVIVVQKSFGYLKNNRQIYNLNKSKEVHLGMTVVVVFVVDTKLFSNFATLPVIST